MSAGSASQVVRMTPELTIYSAMQVRADLLAALQSGSDVTVALDDVCEIDSAGVQLMLAARRWAQVHNASLTWCGHSPVVQEALALLGLDLQCSPATPTDAEGQP